MDNFDKQARENSAANDINDINNSNFANGAANGVNNGANSAATNAARIDHADAIAALKSYKPQELQQQTHIDIDMIEAILAYDFDKLRVGKTKAMIKILEREYNLDLSDWVRKFDEYCAITPPAQAKFMRVKPTLKKYDQDALHGGASGMKWVLVLIVLLLLGGGFVFFKSGFLGGFDLFSSQQTNTIATISANAPTSEISFVSNSSASATITNAQNTQTSASNTAQNAASAIITNAPSNSEQAVISNTASNAMTNAPTSEISFVTNSNAPATISNTEPTVITNAQNTQTSASNTAPTVITNAPSAPTSEIHQTSASNDATQNTTQNTAPSTATSEIHGASASNIAAPSTKKPYKYLASYGTKEVKIYPKRLVWFSMYVVDEKKTKTFTTQTPFTITKPTLVLAGNSLFEIEAAGQRIDMADAKRRLYFDGDSVQLIDDEAYKKIQTMVKK